MDEVGNALALGRGDKMSLRRRFIGQVGEEKVGMGRL
jgi:hypothetical protein